MPDLGGPGRAARRIVTSLPHDVRDPTGPVASAAQELALLEDAFTQLLQAHAVDEPLHACADLVVAVAVVVEGPEARVDRRQQLLARREVLERLRRVRVGAEAAGDEHAEARFGRAVGQCARRSDDADVVEHRLAAVGRASGEVDLELAGESLAVRVAEEEIGGGLRPRRDVEHFLGAGPREVAPHDVAHGVAARLARRQADGGHQAQDLGRLFELDEVELHVLSRREVAPAP